MEMEEQQRARVLLSFGVAGFGEGAEEMRVWRRNLGLASSSRNSISARSCGKNAMRDQR